MLNRRQVDNKFYISGGWQNIERDIEWLKANHVRGILDMQFTPYDEPNVPDFIKAYLADQGIEYHYILMYDGDWNQNLEALYSEGETVLANWDQKYTNRKDRLLVKCAAGISRSVSQYLNYICKRDNIPYRKAEDNLARTERNLLYTDADGTFDWIGGPGPWFTQFLSNKYPIVGSAFGEVVA
jgi:hypothetical protein